MRQLTYFFIIIFIIFFSSQFSQAAIKGNLLYSMPVDYSQLNEQEISAKANPLYESSINNYSGKITEEITAALNLYTMLININPENTTYAVRLGTLYDVIGKDRYAKSCFYRAIGVDQSNPAGYFSMGEFYYKREQYRKALKFYKKAYENGYSSDSLTITRLNDIYKKFGDINSLIK